MLHASIDQDKTTGKLTATKFANVDFNSLNGLWIPCAGSLSPWDTHLGSEEYEPDAREANPAFLADFGANFGLSSPAYMYGRTPEVSVKADGTTHVAMHRVLGRISRELVSVMPDHRTVYQGDDGTYNVLTMFVADRAGDLSSGTLYAARWNQLSASNGGVAALEWIRLGNSTDAQIEFDASTTTFADIFEVSDVDPTIADPARTGFVKVKAGHGTGKVEWLKLKSGKERQAAFLETRRYAAYLGATVEFEKFEGVDVNKADKKLYAAMTRIGNGMTTNHGGNEPADHVKVSANSAGGTYELNLEGGVFDSSGAPIASDWVAIDMAGLVLGKPITKDAVGNTADPELPANPDNLKYSEKLRTLFIGEDSSTVHVVNYVWAYHVDTRKLSRILSLPAGAEATGLQAIDNLNGHAYIMSSLQHQADFSSGMPADLKTRLGALINKREATIGYIAGVPSLK